MSRIALCLAAALALTVPVARADVQQVADPAFHPRLSRPAFAQRPLRVLFDEAHHNFHTLAGRYRPFAELLEADGCTLSPNRQRFTRDVLAPFDVLVIANAAGDDLVAGTDATLARPALTAAEVDAVHAWVRAGGRLLLISDHAPFGAAAAPLAGRFGVELGQGFVIDSLQATDGDPMVIEFSAGRHSLGDHPIMRGRDATERINRVVAFTGQSLRGPAGASELLRLSSVALELPASAAARLDDPDEFLQHARPAAGRCMGTAFSFGRGRVVVLGEAGMLTAQVILHDGQVVRRTGMNREGIDNLQFTLNVVRWLGGALDGLPPGAATTAATPAPAPPVPPASTAPAGRAGNFSGLWHKTAQETQAWRGRGSIGNFEEPLRIEQTAKTLRWDVQTDDPTGHVVFDLTGATHRTQDPQAGELWGVAAWEDAALVLRGRRMFVTRNGHEPFEFVETLRLLDGGTRMHVVTRVRMRPTDLVRTSDYARQP